MWQKINKINFFCRINLQGYNFKSFLAIAKKLSVIIKLARVFKNKFEESKV